MLTPRLTDCIACTTIPVLLADIECKIAELAKRMYNNTVFSLNQPIDGNAMFDLLNYKRILTYKYCNPDYAGFYTIEMIASKVKRLTTYCTFPCDCMRQYIVTTTTTTTTSTTAIPICTLVGNAQSQ